ncbi:MAG: chemotaxis response regulator protein-glutamate methylesterase [Planctomycetota bacterium]|nr:chemotaxis response regulator protein-glutamate methylesterase [Planctomycetota bacterium]
MRVLIVDDSSFMRKAIASMLAEDPAITIVGQASDGEQGLKLARELAPDVITLDVEMPRMDGLTALRRIMTECPTHVLMFSSLTTDGSHAAMTALKLGAADVMAKDASQISFSIMNLKEDLLARVRALAASRKPVARSLRSQDAALAQSPPSFRPGQFELICIGSSTGGPPVVERIVSGLPARIGAPIVIAQHMPELFTRSMTERLAQCCLMPVVHASDGMTLERDRIHIAPGGMNTHIRRTAGHLTLRIDREPAGTRYYPSVDALFSSAAEAAGSRTLAIVLTGMGDDGSRGAARIKDAGGIILAQNEQTCVVYGMPRAVHVHGLSSATIPPESILAAIRTLSTSASAPASSVPLARTR